MYLAFKFISEINLEEPFFQADSEYVIFERERVG